MKVQGSCKQVFFSLSLGLSLVSSALGVPLKNGELEWECTSRGRQA